MALLNNSQGGVGGGMAIQFECAPDSEPAAARAAPIYARYDLGMTGERERVPRSGPALNVRRRAASAH